VEEIITFDFIWDCWKKKEYPENFDDLLEKYLEIKREIFSSEVHTSNENFPAWLNKILISIEIGKGRDSERFRRWEEYWKLKLNREWMVSLEDKWVVWK